MDDGSRSEAYDWRAREADLNNLLPQFRTNLTPPLPATGTTTTPTTATTTPPPTPLRIHFTHYPSPYPNALPLLYLHSSLGLLELTKLIPFLTHPENEGDVAFHVVAPSLPGWGFGEKAGLGVREVAGLWDGLMVGGLGYRGGYVAVGEGGGWCVLPSFSLFVFRYVLMRYIGASLSSTRSQFTTQQLASQHTSTGPSTTFPLPH